MPAVTIAPSDLAPFATIETAKAEAMIVDALAMAKLVAPCIAGEDFDEDKAAAAKAILRGAILRWHEAGQGALSQNSQTAGPFAHAQSFDTRQQRRSLFWPTEIEQLEKLCRTETGGAAWGYDTVGMGITHADTCSLNFGADYCSCGALIAGFPLWETAD